MFINPSIRGRKKQKHTLTELGYEPTVRLKYGLEKEYIWMKENLGMKNGKGIQSNK